MSSPLGGPVASVDPAPPLTRHDLEGSRIRLRTPEPQRDAAALFPATHGSREAEAVWDYLAYGPFADQEAMVEWIATTVASPDPLWHTVTDLDGRPLGMAAMMNADPMMRRLELGHIWYIPETHRQGTNTEAAYLMLVDAFTTYRSRRVEWKCDSLNEPSRRAALRLGFQFEGVFRNHMIVKGRNRDTAWYAMTDDDWERIGPILGDWLDHPDPKPSLSALTAP